MVFSVCVCVALMVWGRYVIKRLGEKVDDTRTMLKVIGIEKIRGNGAMWEGLEKHMVIQSFD